MFAKKRIVLYFILLIMIFSLCACQFTTNHLGYVQATVTTVEPYEGALIVSTEQGYRFKVDSHTKMPVDLVLESGIKLIVKLNDDPAKADPTDYFAEEIKEK